VTGFPSACIIGASGRTLAVGEKDRPMRPRVLPVCACLWAAVLSAGTTAAQETIAVGTTKVEVWQPDAGAPLPQPVIVFSHGFHGCATQARFLTSAFAAAGYLVFAPNHRDATCDGGSAWWFGWPQVPFQDYKDWSETTYHDRADDIRELIAALRTAERWRDRADWSRLGLMGHSLGGYTVLGLAGAWAGWALDGVKVKAVLAFAPYSAPFAWRRTLAGLAAPVMYEGGLLDRLIDAGAHGVLGSYDLSPAPKYYIALSNADHIAWTDRHAAAHEAILAESLAFMNHYLKGAPADPVLTRPVAGVAAFHYQSELGSSDVSQR
jgi:dienelactone hydrolase